MVHFWVIADMVTCKSDNQCQEWAESHKACLKEFPFLDSKLHDLEIIPRLPWKSKDGFEGATIKMAAVRDVFHRISSVLGSAIDKESPTDRFVCVLDARQYSNMGKDEMSSLKTVQGLLILAFPDILWIPVFKGGDEDATNDIKTALNLVAGGFNPLFDGTGVRGALIRTHETNSAYPYYREDVAVAIDEERYFAELAAYTAFRFGYRVYPVSTERLAKQVLGLKLKTKLPSMAKAYVSSTASLVVFEDGDIQFADCNQGQNKTHAFGAARDDAWKLLKTANLRVLATAYGADEKIADGKTMTATEWFRRAGGKELWHGKKSSILTSLEGLRRRAFNLFAGGMADVWVWNLIKGAMIAGVLIWILVKHSYLLLPALLLVFVAFGLFRNAIVGGLSYLFRCHDRILTFFKIRSQWRFYPKLYPNHFPHTQIQQGEGHWCFVRKPLGGIFGLRNQCGLPNGRNFAGHLDSRKVSDIFRNARVGHPTESGGQVKDSSHSAYGMTLDVATDLIGRSNAIKNHGGGIEDAIHAAVLATCAYELLGHKTPALSIEALGLRHSCEVMAECEFHGVRANLDMEDRLVDIHNSMSQICRASNGDIREEMFESGMAAICDSLSELLRSRGRNEEAAFLSRQSRYMHRLLLPTFLRNLLAFPEWAVRSKLNFFASLSIFLGGFALYYVFKIDSGADISDVLAKMYELLFSTQPNMDLTEIMTKANPTKDGPVLKFLEILGVIKLESTQALEDKIASATVVVQAMRQLALIHIGFLAALFYDFMRRK